MGQRAGVDRPAGKLSVRSMPTDRTPSWKTSDKTQLTESFLIRLLVETDDQSLAAAHCRNKQISHGAALTSKVSADQLILLHSEVHDLLSLGDV